MNFSGLQALEAEFSEKNKEMIQMKTEIQQLFDKWQLHQELKMKNVNLPLLEQPTMYEESFDENYAV